ncbi:MAG: RIP metalloprotease RseP [bacterium]|nr:RIP metalloprotease RseP [bacterium]
MPDLLIQSSTTLLALSPLAILAAIKPYVLIFLGFSAVIFVHELGHFLVAKWADVRIDKFCIGFGRELFGFTRGETRYGFNILPLGGYVKMLGQEDFEVDTKGELQVREDPRSFTHKPVGKRMLIVSAGVVMNVIFAALMFMVVFMVGLEVLVTDVGFVKPNSPAAQGGLQVGDKVVSINGRRIHEFSEIQMAIVLSDPFEALDFEVERGGQIKHLKIQPENNEKEKRMMAGMGPAVTQDIVTAPPGADQDRDDLPRFGDKLVEINGQPVTEENANEMFYAMAADPGNIPEVWVERPENLEDPDAPTERVRVTVLPSMRLDPSDPTDKNTINILGLSQLMRFDWVSPDGRAYMAGIRPGDTILKIGDVDYPTRNQITLAIRRACKKRIGPEPENFEYVERDIPIVVQRASDGSQHRLVVRPKVRGHLFGPGDPPNLEANYDLIANDLLRVGAPVEKVAGKPTPAFEAGVPPGALITAVNGMAVTTWVELIEQFRQQAGQTIRLSYTTPDGRETTAEMAVPHCLRTKMGLPVVSVIVSIDGDERVPVEIKGRRLNLAVSQSFGLYKKLGDSVGKTVTVKYAEGFFGELQTAEVVVTEDMIDPWLGRIAYVPNIETAQARKILRTVNPVEAVGIGIKKTYYFVVNVYKTMERMIFTRSVGVENLTGPVGIVKLGSDLASVSLTRLIFFLAMLSANLAVINFLPLPIVDGGLMVFLIIEKIKGTPVSIKTQVVTQVIGLFLIIFAFLYVTYQDLQRFFG